MIHGMLAILIAVVKNKMRTITGFVFIVVSVMPFFTFAQANSSRVVLSVPFAVQAPFGDWSQPWQDFCEEASIVMAAHFVWQLPLAPGMAELEMQIIQQYENMVFRRNRDTSAEETASILRKLYGLKNISVQSVGSTADIKREIQNGKPVVVPAAGQMLENPTSKHPGHCIICL